MTGSDRTLSLDLDQAIELGRLALVGWMQAQRQGKNPPVHLRRMAEGLANLGQFRPGPDNFGPVAVVGAHDADVSPLLREREAADVLGVSARSLRRMASAGRVERVKVGGSTRYRRVDIDRLIEEA